MRVEKCEHSTAFDITAASLIKDACLLADKVHPQATVDDGMVTLMPQESHTFIVKAPESLDPEQLTSPRVLRSVSALVEGDPRFRPDKQASA